jgi:uncharacterized membrane protein
LLILLIFILLSFVIIFLIVDNENGLKNKRENKHFKNKGLAFSLPNCYSNKEEKKEEILFFFELIVFLI